MVASGCGSPETSEIVTVYHKDMKVGNHDLVSQIPENVYATSVFGGIINNRIVIGDESDAFLYNLGNNEWSRAQYDGMVTGVKYNSRGCFIEDRFLVCGGRHGDKVELLEFQDARGENSISFISNNKAGNDDEYAMLSSSVCATRFPLSIKWGHTVTNIQRSSVIVTGGYVDGKKSKKAILGNISQDKADVDWKLIRPMNKGRAGHVAFFLKNNLFVAGGLNEERKNLSSCERYDIEESIWYEVPHELPYPQTDASSATSKDGSFAIITGGYNCKSPQSLRTKEIITFNPQDGFTQLGSVSLNLERSRHVSMTI